jgi:hypothetical protein
MRLLVFLDQVQQRMSCDLGHDLTLRSIGSVPPLQTANPRLASSVARVDRVRRNIIRVRVGHISKIALRIDRNVFGAATGRKRRPRDWLQRAAALAPVNGDIIGLKVGNISVLTADGVARAFRETSCAGSTERRARRCLTRRRLSAASKTRVT